MTRPPAETRTVLNLASEGYSASEISRLTQIPRGTVRDWLNGLLPGRASRPGCAQCGGPVHRFNDLPPEYVYLLGIYLGDGCVSAHSRGVYRLRIYLDSTYPQIIEAVTTAIREVAPSSGVGRHGTPSALTGKPELTTIQVSSYSRKWPCLLPQHGPGKKHERTIVLTSWQRALATVHPELLLRGLIHSDGCRFTNTGRGGWRCARYAFANRSADIRGIAKWACELLDLHTTEAP